MNDRRAEEKHDALIVGGGVIGLACAWAATGRGLDVCVLERDQPSSAASAVAAGMLAPVSEASWGEDDLLALNLASHRLWPEFASELGEASGREVGYRDCGAIHVALDRDEAEQLRRHHRLHGELGLASEWLRPRQARRLEPGLAPGVTAALHVPGEAAVDPRLLAAALLRALERAGVPVIARAEVVGARFGHGAELRTADGRWFAAQVAVLAAGPWSGGAQWVPEGALPPVRPVKGEILTLRGSASDPVCERMVATERVYVVPRGDGRVIVGATVEERGFDTTVTAGGVHELLREAYRALPDVAELELVETRAGLRPGTPDNAPIIGVVEPDELIVATGHYRNGILLAPITGESVAALLAGDRPPVDLAPFSPARFGARSGAGSERGAGEVIAS
jgi:glycine oxidase